MFSVKMSGLRSFLTKVQREKKTNELIIRVGHYRVSTITKLSVLIGRRCRLIMEFGGEKNYQNRGF